MKKKKVSDLKSEEALSAAMKEIFATNPPIDNALEEGKTISIKDLPACRHRELMEIICLDLDVKICVVAWLNQSDGSWVAFAGYPDVRDLKPFLPVKRVDVLDLEWKCENIRDVAAVRMMGDRLEEEEAIKLFPNWNNKTYKEG